MFERTRSKKTFAMAMLAAFALFMICAAASAQENTTDYAKKSADYWYKRGIEEANMGSYEKALDNFDQALSLNPDDPAAWNYKARALRSLAIEEKDTARYCESIQAYDRVLGLYDQILQKKPQDINANYYKGLALSDKATTLKAGEMMFNISGNEAEATSSFEMAIDCFDQALNINPQYITAWTGKGDALYSLERYNESLQAYDSALNVFPSDGITWYHKGLALYELERYQEAISSYETALQTFPKSAEIWLNKGKAFLANGQYNEALESLDYSLKIDPASAVAWYYKGKTFEKLGLNTSAEAAFDKSQSMSRSR
ncbi:MAG: tetratricopeptide repeat protein [Methanotrichaceae archaeon]|nr:tetratricopeptide repeat protein [Methanotrichaceae archaeon]